MKLVRLHPTAGPLRVRVLVAEPLRAADAGALAAVLLRVGFAVEMAEPAEVALCWGASCERVGDDLPAVFMPWVEGPEREADWEKAARALLNPQADVLAHDVPHAVAALLSGSGERDRVLDAHDRPEPADCFLPRHGLLEIPAADRLARALGQALWRASGRPEPPPKPPVYLCPTFDIDSAGMYRGRAALRTAREVLRRRPRRFPAWLAEGISTRLHLRPDPATVIRPLGEMLEGMGIPSTFFVQTHRRHRLDSYDLRAAPDLVHQLRAVQRNRCHAIGLHSSYATNDAGPPFLQQQWRRLRRALGIQPAALHRGHYLRTRPQFLAPGTPAPLKPVLDSSLGFGAASGFRRGTAYPFAVTQGVREAPPVFMDSTARYFHGDDPDAAFRRALALFDAMAPSGGLFIPIWHPHHLEPTLWPGWRDCLIDVLQELRSRGAIACGLAEAAHAMHAQETRLREALEAPSAR